VTSPNGRAGAAPGCLGKRRSNAKKMRGGPLMKPWPLLSVCGHYEQIACAPWMPSIVARTASESARPNPLLGRVSTCEKDSTQTCGQGGARIIAESFPRTAETQEQRQTRCLHTHEIGCGELTDHKRRRCHTGCTHHSLALGCCSCHNERLATQSECRTQPQPIPVGKMQMV